MKRKARAFKIADEPYFKAMERAQKEKEHLANLIEDFVTGYASGKNIEFKKPKPLLDGAFIENKVKVHDLTKENAIGKAYEPKEKPVYPEHVRFTIVNGKKVFK